jgi:hypothetical protein
MKKNINFEEVRLHPNDYFKMMQQLKIKYLIPPTSFFWEQGSVWVKKDARVEKGKAYVIVVLKELVDKIE